MIRERDDFELSLMRAALERDVPMLAICRGSQVLNVALGGDLEQHVPDRVGTESHREVPGVFSEHGVDVAADTRLASLLGERHDVKSHHHQGFGELGDGLASPRAPRTARSKRWRTRRAASPWASCGIPKRAKTCALFEALVAEAREYRTAKQPSLALSDRPQRDQSLRQTT